MSYCPDVVVVHINAYTATGSSISSTTPTFIVLGSYQEGNNMEEIASLEVEGRLYTISRDGVYLHATIRDMLRSDNPSEDVLVSLPEREWKSLIKLLGIVVQP
jgi:hypothetical protein